MALPALPSILASAVGGNSAVQTASGAGVGARRFVGIGNLLGFVPRNFFPETTGSAYEAKPLLSPLRDVRKNHIHYPQTVEPVLARAVVPDVAPQWVSFRVWLEAGRTPRFIFPNGPYESRKAVLAPNKRYADEHQGKPGVNRT